MKFNFVVAHFGFTAVLRNFLARIDFRFLWSTTGANASSSNEIYDTNLQHRLKFLFLCINFESSINWSKEI